MTKPWGDCEDGDGEKELWGAKSSLKAESFPGEAEQGWKILIFWIFNVNALFHMGKDFLKGNINEN